MKKAICAVLLAGVVSSSVVPATAQKARSGSLIGQPTVREKVSQGKGQLAAPAETRFGKLAAYSDGQGAYITWQMTQEIGNIGFNVYRVTKDGPVLLTAAKLVRGAAMTAREFPAFGEEYNFFDAEGSSGDVYYVEALGIDGSKLATDRVHPEYVYDLRTVTGKSSTELARQYDLTQSRSELGDAPLTKELWMERQENRMAADPTTHRTVISQPGVARIGVRGTGIVRVPASQLSAAGFNVESDSTQWQLYTDGVEQAIIVANDESYIEFFGTGTNTPETDIRTYYLTSGASEGKRMRTKVAAPTAGTVVTPTYFETFAFEENTNYIDDVNNGELENYFGRGIGSSQQTINFNLTGVDLASPRVTLFVRFQGYSLGSHSVEVVLNDEVLAPAPGPVGPISFSADYVLAGTNLREGTNTIKFRTIGPTGDFVFFDRMEIGYNRGFVAQSNKLAFVTQNYRMAQLSGFSSPNIRVFDTTYEGNPSIVTNLNVQNLGSSFGIRMPADRSRAFFAVDDAAVLAPFSVTANNPELVGAETNSADLVIITHRNFMAQAQAWAAYRSGPGQGHTVKVIEASELYDEFNYGVFGSEAIRRFLQHATESWAGPPKYALLIGDSSVDSRNYENQGYWNMVPSPILSAVYMEVASDESMADFDGDSLAEIPVGRIASRDAAGIDNVLAKVIKWETYDNALMRGTLWAFDDAQDYDFGPMSERIRNQLPVDVPATYVMKAPGATTTLVNAMNTPKWTVNYAGHGATGTWAAASFFSILTVDTLAENENNPAVYTMLTCLNGAFHYLWNETLAERLTRRSKKGAVAAWASTGKTLPNVQERMATRFFLKAGEGNIPRLGDLIRDAKGVVTLEDGGSDVRRSWALLGDPMLEVRDLPAPAK